MNEVIRLENLSKTKQIILFWGSRCPVCGSSNTTQTGDHSSSGANSYVCNSCGTRFGN